MEPIQPVIKKRGRKPKKKETNNILENNGPKKRGRKPKLKNKIEEVKIPKKRGRKPKPKTEEVKKVPKKRGRKPKEKVYSVHNNLENDLNDLNNNIILHLPIKSSDINNDNNLTLNNLLNYNPDLKEPEPFEPNSINNYSKVLDNKITEKVENDNHHNNTNMETEKILDVNEKPIIKKEEDLDIIKEPINYDIDDKLLLSNKNVLDTNYEFIDANKKKSWPVKTDVYCYWCCHSFDTPPVPLPSKLLNNKYYVTGCFCSFNCAAAYNFDKDYSNKWDRYSLLHLLYKNIYDIKFKNITLSPPRETLKIFGGHLSITEYRKNLIGNTKSYKIVSPPIISMIPKIEENTTRILKNNSTFIPVNKNLINKASLSLKLKREKPITETNKTLYSYMDLKVS